MSSNSIRLEKIEKGFSKEKILNGVNLEVETGQVLAVLGISGAGKTTILRIMAGLEVPERGRVVINGNLATDGPRILIPPHKRKIGFVFQNLGLWQHMTVEEHIKFVLKTMGIQEDVEEILRIFDLLPHREKRPHQLSGGEKQRLSLARSLAQNPDFLLMDEPLTNLDLPRKRRMREEILKIRGRGIGIVYVTHDPLDVKLLSDRIAVLHEGQIIQSGTFEELVTSPHHPIVKELLTV